MTYAHFGSVIKIYVPKLLSQSKSLFRRDFNGTGGTNFAQSKLQFQKLYFFSIFVRD